ncbi:hypothetical protein V6N13_120106 [Hibiscus sabdariffa]|uniref:Uncharacterized protein n=1 Tax=Hibiscus sabdariffa TaxID=183260 RepID=A0ABR2E386_9ROSI
MRRASARGKDALGVCTSAGGRKQDTDRLPGMGNGSSSLPTEEKIVLDKLQSYECKDQTCPSLQHQQWCYLAYLRHTPLFPTPDQPNLQ